MKEDAAFLKSVNKFAISITIFIDFWLVVGYLAAWYFEEYPFWYVSVVFLIMIVGMSISVVALCKWPQQFRYVEMVAFAILYMVGLRLALNDHMYVLVFPIITMYVLYFDLKFICISAIVFGLINIMDVLYITTALGSFHSGMELEAPVLMLQLGSVLVYLVALVWTTAKSNRNNKEKLDLIELKFVEAESASKAKSTFLANMSHEIRTPINTVLGLDTMILRECKDDTIKKYAMNIQSAGQSLLSIINDLLDFSKIESGKMEILCVDYDLSSMISDVTNMISNKAERKGLKFDANIDCSMPSRLYGDDVRIRQVLINLLTNAVKYTHKGSVTLTITGYVVEDKLYMLFSVKDTGIGIKEEDIEKLTSEFVRIEEKRNRHIEGTGLGINIVTQLLKLMNSELQVESEYGVGSDFYFELVQRIVNPDPIGDLETRIRQQATEYSYEVSYVIPEAKLLVVDDNAMNRMVFMDLLKNLKCEIHEADSGKKCLELVKSYKYDIIFMDHMMPEMDGIETLHALQEMSGNLSKGCKVICLTANAVSGAKKMYMSEGFDDFLSKPIVPDKLEKMIFHLVPDHMIQEVESDIIEMANEEQREQTENPDIGGILESLPKIDGVDWNYAWLHLPKKELLESTLKTFYQTIHTEADYLADMYERIHSDEGDSEAMELFRIKVHAMKSSATLIGALPLAGTAAMLEFASRDGERQLVLEVTPYFLEKWRSFKDKLQEIVEPEGNESKEKIEDKGDVIDYLNQLILAANNFDVDGADSALEHLQIYDYPSELKDLLDKVAGAVQNLDAENVEKLGKQMIDRMKEE